MIAHSGRPARVVVYGLFLATVALGVTVVAVRDRFIKNPEVRSRSVPGRADSDSRAGILIDSRRQQLIGVRTVRVERASIKSTIRAVGVVRQDERRVTDFNLKLDGWIKDLYVSSIGQRVSFGQPLLTIYSQELDSLQGNFLAALKAREQQAPAAQVADAGAFADRLVGAPRQRLKQWDVAESELRVLEETRQIPPAVIFRSPMNGVIIEKSAVRGMHVQSGQTLYRIADLSVVLVEADFREMDAYLLKQGGRAAITMDAWPGQHFAGSIQSTYPYLSEQTRTLKARIELPNGDGRLKPGMFANVELSGPAQEGLLVPADSVVNAGLHQIVFVARGGGYFEPRPVTLGARTGDHVLIETGLRENEEIVTRAAFFLDSESQMRAALQDYESMPSADVAGLDFSLQITPDPPRVGENVIQVRLSDSTGRPVTDADVQVRLSMPPMPSMNMPAMRSDTRLAHSRDGIYRGFTSISMAGRWDLAITAERQGRRIAGKYSTLLVQ